MKKVMACLLFSAVLIIGACSNSDNAEKDKAENDKEIESEEGTRTYASDFGDVVVPANPQRVVMASWHYPGHLLSLGITPIAVYEMAKDSEFLGDQLKDVEVISDGSMEKILALNPDLIIANSNHENLDKLKEIAPTVVFELGKDTRLETFLKIGEVVGKEGEAKKQMAQWEERVATSKQKFAEKFDMTQKISVIGEYDKQLYVYGPNHGRGTEVLYAALGLDYPQTLKDALSKVDVNYHAFSEELLPDFIGDYVFVAGMEKKKKSILDQPMYESLPVVQQKRVHFIHEPTFYFSDPISLNGQLDFFERILLGDAIKVK
ncbi:iron complex transport system substrate-binding protein [Filibacter limicola]|uniref:Iron complex transport system substrate-binding protein n=1 Tax=Sporosarcina limicola TaxID=34101 RepID=A0A927MKI0_9BACL|nr:ABC transporter substrate-binding protein [Sporosarcina limicola]MBE1554827.1 iron complex transport system substrate-binding protein [Sporosarcina limicola]